MIQEAVFTWIRNIAYYLIMTTALFHVLPNNSYQKYIRLFTGMILILLMATPILKLFGVDSEYTAQIQVEEYERKLEEIEASTGYLNEVDVEGMFEDVLDVGEETKKGASKTGEGTKEDTLEIREETKEDTSETGNMIKIEPIQIE